MSLIIWFVFICSSWRHANRYNPLQVITNHLLLCCSFNPPVKDHQSLLICLTTWTLLLSCSNCSAHSEKALIQVTFWAVLHIKVHIKHYLRVTPPHSPSYPLALQLWGHLFEEKCLWRSLSPMLPSELSSQPISRQRGDQLTNQATERKITNQPDIRKETSQPVNQSGVKDQPTGPTNWPADQVSERTPTKQSINLDSERKMTDLPASSIKPTDQPTSKATETKPANREADWPANHTGLSED